MPYGQAHVTFNLQRSRDPVVRVEVRLGGEIAGRPMEGADLRNVYGAYFTLPAGKGSYKLTVSAKTEAGCEDGALRPMTVVVQ